MHCDRMTLARLVLGSVLYQSSSSSGVEWRFPRACWWVEGIQPHLPALGGRWCGRRTHQSPGLSQNCFCRVFLVPLERRSEVSGLAALPLRRARLPGCRHSWHALSPTVRLLLLFSQRTRGPACLPLIVMCASRGWVAGSSSGLFPQLFKSLADDTLGSFRILGMVCEAA